MCVRENDQQNVRKMDRLNKKEHRSDRDRDSEKDRMSSYRYTSIFCYHFTAAFEGDWGHFDPVTQVCF